MKPAPIIVSIGKWIMRQGGFRILIADDEAAYFNQRMIEAADKAGYSNIERIHYIDQATLDRILRKPPHIIILDVKGVCAPEVAKDGMDLASMLHRETGIMVVITSAHQFHLDRKMMQVDHVIETRNLTSVDFINELSTITDKFLHDKVSFYKHVLFRAGYSLARGALQ